MPRNFVSKRCDCCGGADRDMKAFVLRVCGGANAVEKQERYCSTCRTNLQPILDRLGMGPMRIFRARKRCSAWYDESEGIEFRVLKASEFYRVSIDGRVQGRRGRNGRGKPSDRWYDLKPWTNKAGYLMVTLTLEFKKTRGAFVHRIVLETWGDRPRQDGELCRHLDGNRRNNHVSNLAWGTPAENAEDAIRHGMQKGERNHQAKLIESDIIEIRKFRSEGASYAGLASMYKVSFGAIANICQGKTWRHLLPPA